MGRSSRTPVSAVVALALVSGPVSSEEPSPIVYPIPRLLREAPPEAVFGLQGWVAYVPVCPPCPPDVTCSPCPPPFILVSSSARSGAGADETKPNEVRLMTGTKQGFVRGAHYRFRIRRATGPEAGRPGVFDLLDFERVPASAPALVRVADPARTAVVRAALEDRLGRDFALDHLPPGATLERAFRYLTGESRRELVRGALTGVPTIHGLELDLSFEKERVTGFAFSPRPDFEGELVYAVSRLGDEWPVFLRRSPEASRRP